MPIHVCLLWRNVYLDLPNFWLGYLFNAWGLFLSFLLKDTHKISHVSGPRAEAVTWRIFGQTYLLVLENLLEKQGSGYLTLRTELSWSHSGAHMYDFANHKESLIMSAETQLRLPTAYRWVLRHPKISSPSGEDRATSISRHVAMQLTQPLNTSHGFIAHFSLQQWLQPKPWTGCPQATALSLDQLSLEATQYKPDSCLNSGLTTVISGAEATHSVERTWIFSDQVSEHSDVPESCV